MEFFFTKQLVEMLQELCHNVVSSNELLCFTVADATTPTLVGK
jgi:hypothetical protein